MAAQVIREWEMGLWTEQEVQDLASYALSDENACKEGPKETLKILLALGARPRTVCGRTINI